MSEGERAGLEQLGWRKRAMHGRQALLKYAPDLDVSTLWSTD
jgi:hypothetical protein